MDNSIYVALSKQAGAERQLAVIANNIANANTAGYKSESVIFSQYLRKDSDGQTAYANDVGTSRNMAQGTFQSTGNPLDLAIQGDGYFGVTTPEGDRYTRAGNFTINDQGELVNSDGFQVHDQSGQAVTFEPEDSNITVFADGRIEVNGENRGSVGVYKFENKNSLEKAGGNLYTSSEVPVIDDEAKIAQGMIEASNVNPIMEMTKMLQVQRDYDGAAKFINTMYELQDTAVRTFAKE